jgi:hypothetical protein
MSLLNISKNKFLKVSIAAFILMGIFLPIFNKTTYAVDPRVTEARGAPAAVTQAASTVVDVALGPLTSVLPPVGGLLVRISALVLAIMGIALDFILDQTVVNMSTLLSSDPQKGIGSGISDAWGTLRDLANLAFIFVLIYAAIRVILDMNTSSIGSTIKNIIIVGLLINFSMFFTKVVIDAANIPTVGFYNAIQAGVANSKPIKVVGSYELKPGFASLIMQSVGVQSIFGADLLPNLISGSKNTTVFLSQLIGSVVMLILSVIFLVVCVMFITRFILLVIIIIVSPAALVAFILPGMNKYFNQWKDSLIGQAAFAPVFMLMVWVSLRVLAAPGINWKAGTEWSVISSNPGGAIGLLINYALVIGFMVASLVIAKSIASKSTGFSAINSMVGTGVMGGAALLGRQTMGRYANKVASDKTLQEAAARGDIGARMKLATASKMAGSSFDVRGVANTKVGKAVGADKALGGLGAIYGQSGFKGAQKAKTDKRRERTDDVLKRYRNNADVLAQHIMSLSSGDQQYMYDKLSARDRAALDDALEKKYGANGIALTTKLRNNLNPEEKEKTEKAARDAADSARSKEIRDILNDLAAGRPVPTNPATGTPYTYDDLLIGRNKLKVTEARKLSLDALNDEEVIKRLTPKHLADIIANKDDLDDPTTAFIVSTIDMAPYPAHLATLQVKQHNYIHGAAKDLWGVT